jgi:hypothetical protein
MKTKLGEINEHDHTREEIQIAERHLDRLRRQFDELCILVPNSIARNWKDFCAVKDNLRKMLLAGEFSLDRNAEMNSASDVQITFLNGN